jgi:hypothetical protein
MINFQSFYHIAAMNHWYDIVQEQKKICDELNIKPICGFLGDHKYVHNLVESGLDIQYFSENINEYEIPTLKLLYDWSNTHPDSYVMYFHTKGASSNKDDIFKTKWRHIMNDFVIKKYQSNIQILESRKKDVIGVNWTNAKRFNHFSGNFWIAKTNYINCLTDPCAYSKNGGINGKIQLGKEPWDRMSAEMWIGDCKEVIAESLYFQGKPFSRKTQFIYDYQETKLKNK